MNPSARSGTTPVPVLLAHGGWALLDPRPIQAANPTTFALPAPDELASVQPGHTIRALFEIAELADHSIDGQPPWNADGTPNLVVCTERMWLWVQAVEDGADGPVFVGVLQNLPVGSHTRVEPGATIRVPAPWVIAIDAAPSVAMADDLAALAAAGFPVLDAEVSIEPIADEWTPAVAPSQLATCSRVGARPERPAPHLTRFVASANLTPDARPIYGARFRPTPGRGDSGWVFWAEHPAMDDDRLGPLSVITLDELMQRCPTAMTYLALPPGWTISVHSETRDDLWFDGDLLTS